MCINLKPSVTVHCVSDLQERISRQNQQSNCTLFSIVCVRECTCACYLCVYDQVEMCDLNVSLLVTDMYVRLEMALLIQAYFISRREDVSSLFCSVVFVTFYC